MASDLFVGRNILLRSSSPTHPQQSNADAAIKALEQRKDKLVLVPQVLYEFWVVSTRPKANNGLGDSPAIAEKSIAKWLSLFELLSDVPEIFEKWRLLVTSCSVSGKPAHDARLVAAIQAHGCDGILTFNAADFQRYQPLRIISPAEVITE